MMYNLFVNRIKQNSTEQHKTDMENMGGIFITKIDKEGTNIDFMECYANCEYNKNDVYSLFKMKGEIE